MNWVERTHDYELIRRIATNPVLYESSSDDFSPSREDFQPIENDSIVYLAAVKDDQARGILMFTPCSQIMYDVHICFLPDMWGDSSRLALLAAFQWMWDNTSAQRIIAQIPEENRLALQLALDSGMRAFGQNGKCFLKKGMLRNMILLGISKGEN